ncbi:hypothetical protein RJ641_009541 [Dillenia turbinata]|uniref:Uncharacterized protein n=1 Tax=Dillenia turbinata TaxID=194707 RepID=A0AAN8Z7F9_9MAGN
MLYLNSVVSLHPAILAISLFICAAAVAALCASHAKDRTTKEPNNSRIGENAKALFRGLAGKKAINAFKSRKRIAQESGGQAEEGYGSGGVWQKPILMGDKCQPLNFSGVINYDGTGKQLSEPLVRSPKPSDVTRSEEIEEKENKVYNRS